MRHQVLAGRPIGRFTASQRLSFGGLAVGLALLLVAPARPARAQVSGGVAVTGAGDVSVSFGSPANVQVGASATASGTVQVGASATASGTVNESSQPGGQADSQVEAAINAAGTIATSLQLGGSLAVAVDEGGNLVVADSANHVVLRIDARTGLRTFLAGTGAAGFSGDGGAAASAQLNAPAAVAVDARGNLYIADRNNHRIRLVAAGSGAITTVAGTGAAGFSGDGGAAASAQLNAPAAVAVDADGNLYIVDQGNNRLRVVVAGTGRITTVAGTGAAGFSGDGGAAASAQLNAPAAVAVDARGNLYIADRNNHRIRLVAAGSGTITTVAGTGTAGFSGDGTAAASAHFNAPSAVVVDASGNVFVAEGGNHRVARIDARTGLLATVAGTGTAGFSGDGGAAASAQLNAPGALVIDVKGNLFIADQGNSRIRVVAHATAGTRATITAPADGIRISLLGLGLNLAAFSCSWTSVAGAAQYGFEFTGSGRQFANPNGTSPDTVNGLGGAGGGFVVAGTGFTTGLGSSIPLGTYQVRVIGLSADGRLVGTFSDAVTVTVE
jgi:sugar lactone lactonase YvrE